MSTYLIWIYLVHFQFYFSVLDALGKPPAGLLRGKFAWLGDYDECIGIEAEEFHGEYCLAKFYVASISNPVRYDLNL